VVGARTPAAGSLGDSTGTSTVVKISNVKRAGTVHVITQMEDAGEPRLVS
jgi:hypothetical protein